MPISTGVEVALRALTVLKTAQKAIANNIANASTPGYSRRRVSTTLINSADGIIPVSEGTQVDVQRIRDKLADIQLRGAIREESDARTSSEALDQIEIELDPLGARALPVLLKEFTATLTEVSMDAADPVRKIAAIRKAEEFAAGLSEDLSSLSQRRTEINTAITDRVVDVNRLLTLLADLNGKLRPEGNTGSGRGNDILDRRDRALDELSALIQVNAIEVEFGKMVISIDGHAVVEGNVAHKIETVTAGITDPVITLRVIASQLTIAPGAGSIGALGRVRDGSLLTLQTGHRSVRDFFAATTGGSVNAVHAAGYTTAGAVSGLPLFELNTTGGLRVRAEIAADPDLLAAGAAAGEGDGDNAMALVSAAEAVISGGKSVQVFLNALYTDLGFEKKLADDSMDAAESFMLLAQRRADSVRGVSLDEEAASLLQFQRSYQALIRYMGMMDEILQLTINMGAR